MAGLVIWIFGTARGSSVSRVQLGWGGGSGSFRYPSRNPLPHGEGASWLAAVGHSIGGAGDTAWPKGAALEVQLGLVATVGTNGQLKVSGDLLIRNPSDVALTIQTPQNRLVLAFLVFDPLGNPVAPKGIAKVDPAFQTRTLSARSTYTHHFESLDFITGSALFGYELNAGMRYKVLAVYRPAGLGGPGFTSQEAAVEVGR